MTNEEYQRRQAEEDERFGFILRYYNGRYSREYEKRFWTRKEMNEFIDRNKPSATSVGRFVKAA